MPIFSKIWGFLSGTSYEVLGLADARKTVKELRAQVALGRDPSREKQERKAVALAKIEEAKNVRTVGQLADEYFTMSTVDEKQQPIHNTHY